MPKGEGKQSWPVITSHFSWYYLVMTNVSDTLQMVIPSKELYILRSFDNGAECRYNSVVVCKFLFS